MGSVVALRNQYSPLSRACQGKPSGFHILKQLGPRYRCLTVPGKQEVSAGLQRFAAASSGQNDSVFCRRGLPTC